MYFDKFYIEHELSSFYTIKKKKRYCNSIYLIPPPSFSQEKCGSKVGLSQRHRQSWGDMKALLPFALGIEPGASCMLNKSSTTELWPKF